MTISWGSSNSYSGFNVPPGESKSEHTPKGLLITRAVQMVARVAFRTATDIVPSRRPTSGRHGDQADPWACSDLDSPGGTLKPL